MVRKLKISGETVLRITNWMMMTGKKFTSVIFNVQLSLTLDPFISKFFHGAIALWDFLFKIKRIDSPVCCFCEKVPETIIHIFCKCDLVKPLWLEIGNIFLLNTEFDSQFSNLEKVFGIIDNKFLTYIILYTKYFIYRSKFQDKKKLILMV